MEADRTKALEAEVIALKRAFIGFAALFARQAEPAEHVLRTAAEELLTHHAGIENCRAGTEANMRVAGDIAAQCAYFRSLSGRGVA